VKTQRLQLPAFTAQNHDVVQRGERRGAAGHAESLHDIHRTAELEVTGAIHLTEDENAIAHDLPDGDRDHRIGNVALQALGKLGAQLLHGFAASVYVARKRERKRAVRPHEHFGLQVLLFPHRHLQHVSGLNVIRRRHVDIRRIGHGPRRDEAARGQRSGEQKRAEHAHLHVAFRISRVLASRPDGPRRLRLSY
jgi:hypothetical protein